MCTTLHFKMAQVGEGNLTALINLHCASVLKLNVIGDVILSFHHAPTVGRIFKYPFATPVSWSFLWWHISMRPPL